MADLLQQLKNQNYALNQSSIIAQTDAKGKLVMVNDKFCEISGYSRDELIGRDHRIVNSGTHPKSFFKEMWQTISSGKSWNGEICNRKKTGDLYWVTTTITPFLDSEGKPYQYLAIRQDITELKLAQQTILDQQTQLINASRLSAIGEMAAAIAHEINNPLAIILGRTEMLQMMVKKGTLDIPTLSRLVESISTTGKRIERIVRGMQTLSHHGISDEPKIDSSLKEILADAIELCTDRFRNSGIELKPPEVSDEIFLKCRSHEIVQVIINLLNNAHDAVNGQPDAWVRLDWKVLADSGQLEISVTDSGKGISPEVQAKLFQPFFSTKRVQYGTGLGLSVSTSLIEGHGGKLYYDKTSPNTRFVIRVPVS